MAQGSKRGKQKRVLMYTHDGRGLGHLRRLSRLAAQLQGECAVLLITGHRSASWIVPENCEYVHIPSLDSIEKHRSRLWGRAPFWDDAQRACLLRARLIEATVDAFSPDAIILDYLPLGRDNEVASVLASLHATKKYFILRGVLDTEDQAHKLVFTPQGLDALRTLYDKIFVTCDPRVCDVAADYHLGRDLRTKLVYVGYVMPELNPERLASTRQARAVREHSPWVVCSAGGGRGGETLMQECLRLSERFCDATFNIVPGPRSQLLVGEGAVSLEQGRVHIEQTNRLLPEMHAACDVMISLGGYNSLVEGISGRATMIVHPHSNDYEQRVHAERLSKYRPLTIVEKLDELEFCLQHALENKPSIAGETDLRRQGAETMARIIVGDLAERSAAAQHGT